MLQYSTVLVYSVVCRIGCLVGMSPINMLARGPHSGLIWRDLMVAATGYTQSRLIA